MRTLIQDVRQALRLFARNPGFTAVSALTIALAIGGCTAVFSVVNGVLLTPLPYPEPGRIVSVAEEHPGSPSTLSGLLFSNHTYHAWAPTAKTVTAVGAYNQRRFTVSGDALPEADRVPGTTLSPSLLRVLGVAPHVGRAFEDADAASGAAPVVLLSHEFWTSRLGGDPAVVGRVLRLDAGDVRTSTASGRGSRPVLLALEAALAVVLLVGAALLGRSFVNLLDVDAGYDPAGVLTANLVQVGMDDELRMTAVTLAVLERVRALPGVTAAGAGNMAPFAGSTSISGFTLPGERTPDGQPVQARALYHTVTPGYFEALGMQTAGGRFPVESDTTAPTRATLVNEAFVRTYYTDGRPVVGRRYAGLLGDGDSLPFEIVGIVKDALPAALDGKAEPAIYVTQGAGLTIAPATFVLRTSGDPEALGPALRSVVREIEPSSVALDAVATLSSQVAASVGQPRFAASVLAVFALLALSLAAIGLYGVLSYNVSARRREMGVRAALGATRRDLIALVMRQGLGVTIIGLAAGLAASALLTRLMETMLFGVEALDLISFAAAPMVLLLVALAACLVPAMRAAGTDPAIALRAD